MSFMINKIIEDYSKSFMTHGDSPKSVMWPKGRQEERFEALLRFMPKENHFSILDYGCGLAHLIEYLEKKFKKFDYTGCDIVNDFIEHNSKKYKQSNFFNSRNKKINMEYDYTVVSGAFNILYYDDEVEHKKVVFETIKTLFKHTNKILSINFMTDQVDFKSPKAYHQNVKELYDFCYENITKRLNIDQTYMPYEYTITLFCDQEIQIPVNTYNVNEKR